MLATSSKTRTSKGTGCFDVSTNSIGVFSSPYNYKLFIYSIFWPNLQQPVSTNTFKSALLY